MIELWRDAVMLQRVLGASDDARRAQEMRLFLGAAKDTPIQEDDLLFQAKQVEYSTAAGLRTCGVGFASAVVSRIVLLALSGRSRRVRGLDVAVPIVSMGLSSLAWMVPESMETTAALLSLPASPTSAAARQRIRDALPDSILADVLERRAAARMPTAPSMVQVVAEGASDWVRGLGRDDEGEAAA